jgi:hypothetical protein
MGRWIKTYEVGGRRLGSVFAKPVDIFNGVIEYPVEGQDKNPATLNLHIEGDKVVLHNKPEGPIWLPPTGVPGKNEDEYRTPSKWGIRQVYSHQPGSEMTDGSKK